jgi:pentapeptide MXKDX repeat protein
MKNILVFAILAFGIASGTARAQTTNQGGGADPMSHPTVKPNMMMPDAMKHHAMKHDTMSHSEMDHRPSKPDSMRHATTSHTAPQ